MEAKIPTKDGFYSIGFGGGNKCTGFIITEAVYNRIIIRPLNKAGEPVRITSELEPEAVGDLIKALEQFRKQ